MKTLNSKTKIIIGIVIVTMMMLLLLPASVFASTSSSSFDFRILPHQANGQVAQGRDRKNVSVYDEWHVKLEHSGQGNGSLTDFWLEVNDGTNVSPYKRVQCNSEWYGQTDYASSRERTVYLTGEDNQYIATGYTVSGLWKPQS